MKNEDVDGMLMGESGSDTDDAAEGEDCVMDEEEEKQVDEKIQVGERTTVSEADAVSEATAATKRRIFRETKVVSFLSFSVPSSFLFLH